MSFISILFFAFILWISFFIWLFPLTLLLGLFLFVATFSWLILPLISFFLPDLSVIGWLFLVPVAPISILTIILHVILIIIVPVVIIKVVIASVSIVIRPVVIVAVILFVRASATIQIVIIICIHLVTPIIVIVISSTIVPVVSLVLMLGVIPIIRMLVLTTFLASAICDVLTSTFLLVAWSSRAALLLFVVVVIVLRGVVSWDVAGHAISFFVARSIPVEGVIVGLLALVPPFILSFLMVVGLPRIISFVAFTHIFLLLAWRSLPFRNDHVLLLSPFCSICWWLRLLLFFGLIFLAILGLVIATIIEFLLLRSLISILLMLSRLFAFILIESWFFFGSLFLLCEGLKRCRTKAH